MKMREGGGGGDFEGGEKTRRLRRDGEGGEDEGEIGPRGEKEEGREEKKRRSLLMKRQ